MRTNLSTYLRDEHKGLRTRITEAINEILVANDNSLQLDDDRGSLIYNVIDDQESEVIRSIVKTNNPDTMKPPTIEVWIGVYEDDYSVDIEEFDCNMLLNVLEACERAIE